MTQVETKEAFASERQLAYLDDLVKQRDIPNALADKYAVERNLLRRTPASTLITTFLKFPKKSFDFSQVGENMSERQKLMAELMQEMETFPEAKYAIPADELMIDLLKRPIKNDLVFCELKKYRGRLYFKQLHGAPGSFSRSMFPVEDALVFTRIIKKDPYKYTKLFADHYKCCGKCGAELTDEVSRELRLGPVCRKGFGV